MKDTDAGRILEVGCGCGLISIALARKNTEVIAVDVSMEACRNTLANFKNNNPKGIVHIVNGDITSAFRSSFRFDMVVSNPPYLPVEPSPHEDASWAAGEENVFSRKLLENSLPLLSNSGIMLIVQSSLTSLDNLKRLVSEKGFYIEEVSSRNLPFEKIGVLRIIRKAEPD